MDPDANIREQIELTRHALRAGWTDTDHARLLELRQAYTGWRAGGGYAALPALTEDLRVLRATETFDYIVRAAADPSRSTIASN